MLSWRGANLDDPLMRNSVVIQLDCWVNEVECTFGSRDMLVARREDGTRL